MNPVVEGLLRATAQQFIAKATRLGFAVGRQGLCTILQVVADVSIDTRQRLQDSPSTSVSDAAQQAVFSAFAKAGIADE